MIRKGSLVRGGLQVAAACFGRGFVNVPAAAMIQYSTMRLCELEESWFNALIRCYQLGYGASGPHEWGEGAHCPQHPFGKDGHAMLSLAEFEKLLALDSAPSCKICGCTLVLCYSDDYLRKRLVLELTRNRDQDPLTTLMIHSGQMDTNVVGFCYGAMVVGFTLIEFVCYHEVNQYLMVGNINISIILIVITILWNLFLAFSVLFKNPQKSSHRLFFALIFILTSWIFCSFFANEPLGKYWQNVLLRFDLASGIIGSYLFLLFVSHFPKRADLPQELALRLLFLGRA